MGRQVHPPAELLGDRNATFHDALFMGRIDSTTVFPCYHAADPDACPVQYDLGGAPAMMRLLCTRYRRKVPQVVVLPYLRPRPPRSFVLLPIVGICEG